MEEPSALDPVAEQAVNNPEKLDYRLLCQGLAADDYEISHRANEIRDEAIQHISTPATVFDALWSLLTDDGATVRQAAVETLYRVVRVWPQELTPRVATGLTHSDVRCQAAAADNLGRLPSGVVRPHVPELVDRLDDSDVRVAALSLNALLEITEDFPGVIAPHLDAIIPFLTSRWIRTNGGGMKTVYSKTDHESDKESGELPGERLTNRATRPLKDATSALTAVSVRHPEAVAPMNSRLISLAEDLPTERANMLLPVFTHLVRYDPSMVEGVRPVVERWAEEGRPSVSAEARTMLRELGIDVEGPAPLTPPDEMMSRTRPSRDEDEERLRGIDQRVITGDVDLDQLVSLLRCRDAETRDGLLWGLSCGRGTKLETDIHQRADTFMSVLNEPNECARSHLFELLGAVVAKYPEAWVPALVELTNHDDILVRKGAVRLLGSAAGTAPQLVIGEIDLIRDALATDQLRKEGLIALRPLVAAAPEVSETFVPTVVAMIEVSELGQLALSVMNELSRRSPSSVTAAMDPTLELVHQLVSEESIEERACWSRESHVSDVGIGDRVLETAFEVSARIGAYNLDLVTGIRPHAERIISDRYYGYKSALMLLAVIKYADKREYPDSENSL
jgi:hypothetical protein